MTTPRIDLDDASRAWDVAGAPVGFADRVLAASEAVPVDDGPRVPARMRVLVVAAVVALAAAVLLFVWSPASERGELTATKRTTLALTNAVAVVEPGAMLEWSEIDGGGIRVRQSDGRAFYRVESGSVFEVVTPAGRVSARGTAFEVEIEDMHSKRKHIASGLAGIGIATAVVVTLYEGRVVVASDEGEVTLAPGETASLRAGERPRKGERETTAALRSELDGLRRELDAERRKTMGDRSASAAAEDTGTTHAVAGRGDAMETIRKCAMTINGGPACSMLHPAQEVLERRADCGVVVYDRPSAVESANVDFTEMADLAGLDDDERAKLEEATRSFHAHVRAQFETIYRELGGDPELAGKLSAVALSAQIDELTGTVAEPGAKDHYQTAAELVASTLAGRRERPQLDELPPGDRHAYLWTAAGDLYEDWLASSLGADRARELREVHDGWTGNRGMQGVPHCPDED
jgi:hypothetical protein